MAHKYYCTEVAEDWIAVFPSLIHENEIHISITRGEWKYSGILTNEHAAELGRYLIQLAEGGE